ncbi:type IV secretion system protein [Trebonia kvetii]|uniref:type IV secretion system protein n=1 Tax=Trebonia kvetii TaxID=2480626 RepID=UPI0016527126|nr:type IV secretion system protein [Trebonia kvetii]
MFSGLFLGHAANAAPLAKAAPAAAASTAEHAAPATTTARLAPGQRNALISPAQPAGGVCSVPGLGDIGGLIGLCNAGSSGVFGDVNNICTPGSPQPELATSGIDSMITTPGSQTMGKTLYDNYGVAGQYWAATGLHCSDMTSLIGNNVAGMVFDMAKSLDRVTITIYQSAAGADILSWLSGSVDQLITALGRAIYFPFLAPMVIIATIWLAWQGLVRKRATRTLEGTIWMVIACAAAIWLIGRPTDFTNVGTTVSNGVTSVLNTAFANLPAEKASNCLPVANGDTQSVTANYSFTSGTGLVDKNANELWTVLVCKPWLDGELGSTQYATGPGQPQTVVNQYGRQLLWAQAVAANEDATSTALVKAKQATFDGIAAQLQQTNPAVYSLFQGDQWTTRLEIGFEALFAAVAAGLLVLLIALTLIILKLGFLLLLVAGPFFLIVGIHPGFGRVIAIRWFEMLVGVLMKQVAVALTLSVLLYCYSLIMSTTDQALPWALKIMMIALVTVAVFIYRKPFQHLFSSVGYGMLGADERAQVSWRESAFGFRRVTANAAGAAMPNVGAARASRWARRGAADAPSAAEAAAGVGGVAAAGATIPEGMQVVAGADSHGTARQWPEAGVGTGRTAPPLPLPPHGGPPAGSSSGPPAGWARGGAAGTGTARRQSQPPTRQNGTAAPASRPSNGTSWPNGASRTRSGESSNGAGGRGAKPPAAPFWSRSRRSK